jgi:hypothetical protein
LADYDGDGRIDLISGCSCCTHAFGFYVFRGQKDGSFAARRRIDLDYSKDLTKGEHDVESNDLRSLLAVADWNGDGAPDVLIGGTATVLGVAYGPLGEKDKVTVERVWPKEEKPFRRMSTNPSVADWDGDGLADVIVGGYKEPRDKTQGVYWLRNVGTKREPKLAEPRLLIADERTFYTTGICVADWNGDGRPDLIASRVERDGPPKYTTRQHRVWVYLRQAR